jgi:hypothetical protein
MPRDVISDKLVSSDRVELFDALKMETGEWARLCVPADENIWWEYVHSMRAPVLDDEDMPVIEDKKRRDGSSAGQGYFMGFVGQRICLGDPAILEDKKLDPARCPACASAARGTAGMTPDRRFAVPVVRYQCKKRNNTDLPATPGGSVLVWKMNQKMYNELVKDNKKAIRELLEIPEGKEFPLRVADIAVFCENGDFSRIVFKPPMRPAWGKDPRYAAWIKELKADEGLWPTDAQLKAACGRDGDREYMALDVASVEDRWRKAERAGKDGARRPGPAGDGPVSGGQSAADLDKSLDALLTDHPGGLDEFASREAEAPVADDPFAEDSAPAAAGAAAGQPADPWAEDSAPEATPAAAAPAASGGAPRAQAFEDILGD